MDTSQHNGHPEGTCKFIKQEELCRGEWLSLHKVTWSDPRGVPRTWEALERTTRQQGQVDAVVIMATLKRVLKYDQILLVKQFRPPIKAYTLEFPAGLVDAGESAQQAAVRELREETGYVAQIKHVSPVTCLDPGTENCTVVLATAEIDGDDEVNKTAEQSLDEGGGRQVTCPCPEHRRLQRQGHEVPHGMCKEYIERIQVPLNELLDKCNEFARKGVVIDARVYSYAIALTQAVKPRRLEEGMK